MKHIIDGAPSFAHITVTLDPNETLVAESGTMASMDVAINQKAKLNGNFFGALIRKIWGRESFFVSHYTNTSSEPASLVIAQKYPGDMRAIKLSGGGFYIQPGAFVACEQGVQLKVKWAGFASLFAGEGLLRNYVFGNGAVFIGGYGAVYMKELDGEYIVDSSHIIGYSTDVKLRIRFAGGPFASLFGGEGLVAKLEGKGKVFLQSRSLTGLATFINPKI